MRVFAGEKRIDLYESICLHRSLPDVAYRKTKKIFVRWFLANLQSRSVRDPYDNHWSFSIMYSLKCDAKII